MAPALHLSFPQQIVVSLVTYGVHPPQRHGFRPPGNCLAHTSVHTRVPSPGDTGAHQLALASLLGFNALAEQLPLRAHTLVIRVPSHAVARAMARGSSSDPAIQDVVMLFLTACMDRRLARPLFFPCSPTSAPAPLTAAQARLAQIDSASDLLQTRISGCARWLPPHCRPLRFGWQRALHPLLHGGPRAPFLGRRRIVSAQLGLVRVPMV